ncbi:DEAD/DEAH box helicase [Mesorhizobium sp. M0954]|uniref:DEAD/DEAH box helicase n=1 Tax=Mesorhizobium sp. M0954 TaxID=2957032 RepID=UPI0033383CB2
MTFALDLSRRLETHQAFRSDFDRLQAEAAFATLPHTIESRRGGMDRQDVLRLMYCAGVFAQTDDETLRALAQAISLGALLIGRDDIPVDASLRLLTDLGNFPALTYAEARHEPVATIRQALRAAISREVNGIDVGSERIALTDFQKRAWDRLGQDTALAISAPTSAGKSFLVIEHLCRTAERSAIFRAVYVAPTRALLSEVYASIQRRLNDEVGIRVSTVPTIDPAAPERQIFVLTQERLQVLLAVSTIDFDLVIVDEAQNFSDGARGMILQECLEQAIARRADTRLVLLAPGAEGFETVADSIGLKGLKASVSLLPSVIQNRILVSRAAEPRTLSLRLLTALGSTSLGVVQSHRGFDHPASRLAAVALELGRTGGSLVYATGPKDAETVALQLHQDCRDSGDKVLEDLAQFIEKHIHPRYALAALVRRGVAFHYGKMPTLLRESIESAFKSGALKFLACTTTLFQGVNLPARNVFIDTPTRGTNSRLDPAALWNFAGRAGRMKADIVGNVFLVDYDEWPDKPMNSFVGYRIEPAFGKAAADHGSAILQALAGELPRMVPGDEVAGKVRAAAGLLIARAARGDVALFASRSLSSFAAQDRDALVVAAQAASDGIGLPATLLSTNWTVDPFGLKRLFNELVSKIVAGEIDGLIPVNPHDYLPARKAYESIFMRAQRLVNLSASRFPALVAGVAVKWMQGTPYPVLLADAIRREERTLAKKIKAYEDEIASNAKSRKRRPKPIDINDVIRKEFDLIEDVIRFRYVQLGKAYIDVLALALRHCGFEARIKEIFDFSLALELGVCTRSGWSFMELGLSRIAAAALEPHFPNSDLSVQHARDWLRKLDVTQLQISSVIVDEMLSLGLIELENFA